jgi:hypothetical protein
VRRLFSALVLVLEKQNGSLRAIRFVLQKK